MPLKEKTRSKTNDRVSSLPTYEVSLDNQLKLLRFIVDVSDSGANWATSQSIAARAAALRCDQDRVTRCFPFLESVDLLERKRGAVKPKPLAIQFASLDDLAGKALLRDVFARAWFGKVITDVLKVTQQVGEERLLQVLAREGKLDFAKQKRVKDKAKKLIEYLVLVDYLVKDSRGKYSLK